METNDGTLSSSFSNSNIDREIHRSLSEGRTAADSDVHGNGLHNNVHSLTKVKDLTEAVSQAQTLAEFYKEGLEYAVNYQAREVRIQVNMKLLDLEGYESIKRARSHLDVLKAFLKQHNDI